MTNFFFQEIIGKAIQKISIQSAVFRLLHTHAHEKLVFIFISVLTFYLLKNKLYNRENMFI